jgi:chloramphenicol 3-O-phosphotransferase
VNRALLLTGGGGAGKTSLGQAIGRLLTDRSLPTAVIDLDALAQFGGGTPAHEDLRRRNLAAVWANYRWAGAQYVVVSGVIESAAQRAAYGECLVGCTVQVVRVAAPLDWVERRTAGTTRGPEWELEEALASHERVERAALEDFVVANDRPLVEVAEEIVARAGWFW